LKYRITQKPHHFDRFAQKTGLNAFQYCVNCGLIALRNEATRKAMNKACVIKEDV